MSIVRAVELVILLGAVVSALALLWHKGGFAKLKRGTGAFLDDWNGEPPRPGYDGRPSFPERMSEVEKRTRQLEGNGGSHLADDIRSTRDDIASLTEQVRDLLTGQGELRGFAADNRQGIARLDQRVTDVQEEAARLGEKADSLGQRQTDHRRRNDEQVEGLRAYLEAERLELMAAKQGLEASVHELLMVDGHERRTADGGADHQPDL